MSSPSCAGDASHPNTVLAVVGGVGSEAARRPCGADHRGLPGKPQPRVPAMRWGGGGRLTLRDRDSNQAYLAILMPIASAPRPLLATGVAVDIVGADPDDRLFQELRERLGLSYEVGAHLGGGGLGIGRDQRQWRSHADRLMRAVTDTCRRAADTGFSSDELERARKLRYRYAILADSRLDQAVALAEARVGFPAPRRRPSASLRLCRPRDRAGRNHAVAGRGVTAILR